MRELTNSNMLVSHNEHIVMLRTTLWTETSKKQEEKKEKSITLVVASETVTAQTNLRIGVVGHFIRSYKITW